MSSREHRARAMRSGPRVVHAVRWRAATVVLPLELQGHGQLSRLGVSDVALGDLSWTDA